MARPVKLCGKVSGGSSASNAEPNIKTSRRSDYQVQSDLKCSIFVLEDEVAFLDRLLGFEIAALFEH